MSNGFELPLRLLMAFRVLIDALHEELAARGHPGMRPMHGFVLQAVSRGADSAASLGRTLGVSKQAAGKTIETLEGLGYVTRVPDPADSRRKTVVLTEHGVDALRRSAEVFDELRARWAAELGAARLDDLEDALRRMTPGDLFRLDVPGWFG
ncbi:MarR family winged helix-turn-helix transcriptional regulator [Herbidospora sp. NBRC 101105]|uniref:MarR family winged helix-turn-helix transcriptional regulator n=1 Tax=Herbidospora sp. NBRC 101105 TaxID=3032195 RepID=UPI0024A15AA1|nr:MarR family winged helix-turn-helix transcriptional regulator [Herbidospora sp. NBRC 101105]GLX94412.1 MarR family transcriptional regulator [Herbidospora sp. NBRC 101105]